MSIKDNRYIKWLIYYAAVISLIAILLILGMYSANKGVYASTTNSESDQQESVVQNQSQELYMVKVTASALNVRSGDSTEYKRVGVLSKGKMVNVYGESGEWLKIKYNGSYRWICGKYTQKIATTTTTTAVVATTTTTKSTTNTVASQSKIKITGSVVNVRKGAGTNYGVVTTVKKGSTYVYTDTKAVGGKTWYKITVGSKNGWIIGTYVTKINNEETNSNIKKFNLSSAHRDYIERVVAAEARGQKYGKVTGEWGITYNGMAAVAQVIYDRAVYKGGWSNTPYGVVTSKNQFAKPYKGKVSKEVRAAVSAVFDYGYRVTDKPLYYFCTKNCYPSWAKKKTHVMTLGNHKFYR